MERWVIIWTNKADMPGVLGTAEENGPATFASFDEAHACWEQHPLSKAYSAWAFDVINGTSEAL